MTVFVGSQVEGSAVAQSEAACQIVSVAAVWLMVLGILIFVFSRALAAVAMATAC